MNQTNRLQGKTFSITRRSGLLIALLLALSFAWFCLHRPVERAIAVHLLLNSKNPDEELFDRLASQSKDPVDFLNHCWATGKITHRQLVAAFLKENALRNSSWFAHAEPLALAGATDADVSIRELTLATLERRKSPRLFECAQAQLNDLDPMVRLLGLNYLRKTEPQLAVPILIPLLDDRDLRVVAEAEVALMRWSGEDYGVRARLALPSQEGIHSATVDPANVETIRRGIDQRKEWWRRHQQEFPVSVMAPQLSAVEPGRPPVADFALENLEGHKVRLSDFRGKVVLLNFWATWCTACLAEIPDLVALQKMNDNHIVILGVALDGVPDEHGHIHREGGHGESLGLKAVHSKIARTVKSRGINYPVLLDAGNSVGSQFNGGELPTTIVIDAEGRIRRRFIGERNLQVFQAMLAEAAKPLGSSRTAAR